MIPLDLFQVSEFHTNLPLLERICAPNTLMLSLLFFSSCQLKHRQLSVHFQVLLSEAAGSERGGCAGCAGRAEDTVSFPPAHA